MAILKNISITRIIQKLLREIARELPLEFLRKASLRSGGVKIGRHCQIGKKCKISRSIIKDDVIIENNVRIEKDCFLDVGSNVRRNSVLLNSVRIGKNVIIGQNNTIANAEIGDNCQTENEVIFMGLGNGKIRIGRESYIGIRNVMDFSNDIEIGDFVHVAGPSTAIWTHSSASQALYGDPLQNRHRRTTDSVKIEDNVYIGGNCTIYPGVCIRHHSVVGSNSVVTKDVEPYSFVGGVPAKVIKTIKIEEC